MAPHKGGLMDDTRWGEVDSPLRMLMVAALIVELKQHIGYTAEDNRAVLLEAPASQLDTMEILLKSWK